MSKRSEFWDWFTDNQAALRPRHITRPMIDAVDTRIQDVVGEVAWEIGPIGDGAQCFLAVSPTSDDPTVNETARLLIREAPSLPGWDFRSFKPPREWELYFELNVGGEMKPVEGARWEVLVLSSHGQWKVIFKPDESCAELPAYALRLAAFTILDGEIGGEDRNRLISDVDVVTSWTPKQKAKAVRLEVGLLAKLLSS